MLVYRTPGGLTVTIDGMSRLLPHAEWDQLFLGDITRRDLQSRLDAGEGQPAAVLLSEELLPPIDSQEVWAAGVTYLRSRTARMEESSSAGGSDFYDAVYHADRPELFFKAAPHRVVGHRQPLALRNDSQWMVPEPELTLAFNRRGELIGYTIGNDLSSRDIEGENPLYLPQAKVFDRCAALGPALLLTDAPPPLETRIEMTVRRNDQPVFADHVELAQMKQTFENLREHLFRSNRFPDGCYLMTGTGIVPPDDFTLQPGDEVAITIAPVGTLVNPIQQGDAQASSDAGGT